MSRVKKDPYVTPENAWEMDERMSRWLRLNKDELEQKTIIQAKLITSLYKIGIVERFDISPFGNVTLRRFKEHSDV